MAVSLPRRTPVVAKQSLTVENQVAVAEGDHGYVDSEYPGDAGPMVLVRMHGGFVAVSRESFDEVFDVVEEPEPVSACQNCGRQWSESQLHEVRNLFTRVQPGEPMPSGQCPACGSLCHELPPDDSVERCAACGSTEVQPFEGQRHEHADAVQFDLPEVPNRRCRRCARTWKAD